METIILFTENIIKLTGIEGEWIVVLRYLIHILTTIILSGITYLALRHIVVPIILHFTKRTRITWDDVLLNEKVLISVCKIAPALVFWKLLPLVFYQNPILKELCTRITIIYIIIMIVVSLNVFINSFKDLESEKGNKKQQYLQTFLSVIKIIIIFLAAIIIIAVLINKSPFTLIAGLGATSAVLMLVFKDTIEGLVAGIRLTGNEMLHKGDWITVKGTDANGIVEEISLTTVKIRNFDNTIITVTPITLVNGSFQNWKGMDESDGRRAVKEVYYDFRSLKLVDEKLKQHLISNNLLKEKDISFDKTNMSLYRLFIEQYLNNNENVNSDMLTIVNPKEATITGLPLEFYFFIKHKDSVNYNHALADIMEYIYASAQHFDLTIYQQYPKQ